MEFKRGDEEVVLLIPEDEAEQEGLVMESGIMRSPSSCFSSSAPTCQCRVCYEEEEESSTTMENPCGCSGSLKYAHRTCIQRWCDEKGSTLCEICLQSFEPDYTVAPKKALIEVGVTIRGSLEVPRESFPTSPHAGAAEGDDDDAVEETAVEGAITAALPAECSPVPKGSASCCRSVAVGFSVFLLLRQLFSVITIGAADQYAFTLLTVFLLRASGVLVPLYVVLKTISAVQQMQKRRRAIDRRPHQSALPLSPPPVAVAVTSAAVEGPSNQPDLRPEHHVIEVGPLQC